MTEWWTGIPAAAATIECGAATHTLRWERGVLTAVDHDDVEAEATLAVLARETVPCLERVRAWNRHRDDVRVLTLASRGLTDRLDVAIGRRPHPRAPIKPSDDPDLPALLALGGGLPDRLQAHAAAAWTQRLGTGHSALDAAVPQLHAALYGRLLVALRVWLGEPRLSLELTMIDADGDHRLERDGDAVLAALPFAWLSEVWARGFSTILGRLCTGAASDDGLEWTLDTLDPDLTTTRQLSITLDQARPDQGPSLGSRSH